MRKFNAVKKYFGKITDFELKLQILNLYIAIFFTIARCSGHYCAEGAYIALFCGLNSWNNFNRKQNIVMMLSTCSQVLLI